MLKGFARLVPRALAGQARRVPSALLAMPAGTGWQSGASRLLLAATAGTAGLIVASARDHKAEAEAASECCEEETGIGFSRILQVKVCALL